MGDSELMFTFLNCFDVLKDSKITLKITRKHIGDSILLPFYYFDIFDENNNPIGKISIRIGNNFHSYYNGHVGFEINENFRGNNYSLLASKLVLSIAQEAHGMKQLYLTCAISNKASRRIIEKLGANLLEVTKIPKECFFWREGIEEYCIYVLEL
jgi:predicted acetyltransferase